MWTDEDVESLFMVADGVVLTTYAGSSVDFRLNNSSIVASIPRTYQNKTVATMFCSAGVFGTMYEYAVTYLGWEEPSMPSVVAIPALPQSVNGAGRTLQLRKGDNSAWTNADVRNLEIKVGNDTCDVVPTETGYDYSLNGTVYCSITGSLVTGRKIPILCHGTSEGQPLNYTITSMELPSVGLVTLPPLPLNIDNLGHQVIATKSDGSEWSLQEALDLHVTVNHTLCTVEHTSGYIYFMLNDESYANIENSSSIAGNTELYINFYGAGDVSGPYTVNSIELG